MKLSIRKQQSKKLLRRGAPFLIVAAGLAVVAAIWFSVKQAEDSGGQAVAKKFIAALEKKDINGALKYTDPSQDTSKAALLYSLAIQNIGKNYKIVEKENKDGKESYIFQSDQGDRYPFIRVIVQEKSNSWRIISFLPNATKPNTSPAK